jgi:hypothetical protein
MPIARTYFSLLGGLYEESESNFCGCHANMLGINL